MLETEADLLHRHPAFEAHTRRREQDEAGPEPQDQRAGVRVFSLHLAGFRGQEMVQQPEVVCNPTPPDPGADQARRR